MNELSKREIFEMLYTSKKINVWLCIAITFLFATLDPMEITHLIGSGLYIVIAIVQYLSMRRIKKIIKQYKRQEQWS